jgi:hypothetical protein
VDLEIAGLLGRQLGAIGERIYHGNGSVEIKVGAQRPERKPANQREKDFTGGARVRHGRFP